MSISCDFSMVSVETFLEAVRSWHCNDAAFAYVEGSEAAVLVLACANLLPDTFQSVRRNQTDGPAEKNDATENRPGRSRVETLLKQSPHGSVSSSPLSDVGLWTHSACCNGELLITEGLRSSILAYAINLAAPGALGDEIAGAALSDVGTNITSNAVTLGVALQAAHHEGCVWRSLPQTTALLLSPSNPLSLSDSWTVRWRCAAVSFSTTSLATASASGSTESTDTGVAKTPVAVVKTVLPRGSPASVIRASANETFQRFFLEKENASAVSEGFFGQYDGEPVESASEKESTVASSPLLTYEGCNLDERILYVFFPRRPSHAGLNLRTYKRRREGESHSADGECGEPDAGLIREPDLSADDARKSWYLCLLMHMLGLHPRSLPCLDGAERNEVSSSVDENDGASALEALLGCELRCGYCAGRPSIHTERSVSVVDDIVTETGHITGDENFGDSSAAATGGEEESPTLPLPTAAERVRYETTTITHHIGLNEPQWHHCACCPWHTLFVRQVLKPPEVKAQTSSKAVGARDMCFTFRVNVAVDHQVETSTVPDERPAEEVAEEHQGSGENLDTERETESLASEAQSSVGDRSDETSSAVDAERQGGDDITPLFHAPSPQSLPPTPLSTASGSTYSDELMAIGEEPGEMATERLTTEGPADQAPSASRSPALPTKTVTVVKETHHKIALHLDMSTVEQLIVCWRASEYAETHYREAYLHHQLPRILLAEARPPPFSLTPSVPAGKSGYDVEAFLETLAREEESTDLSAADSCTSRCATFFGRPPDSVAAGVLDLVSDALSLLTTGQPRANPNSNHAIDEHAAQFDDLRHLLAEGLTRLTRKDVQEEENHCREWSEKVSATLGALATGKAADGASSPSHIPSVPADVVADTITSIYDGLLPTLAWDRADEDVGNDMPNIIVQTRTKGLGQPEVASAEKNAELASAFLEDLQRKTTEAITAATNAVAASAVNRAPTKPAMSRPPTSTTAGKPSPAAQQIGPQSYRGQQQHQPQAQQQHQRWQQQQQAHYQQHKPSAHHQGGFLSQPTYQGDHLPSGQVHSTASILPPPQSQAPPLQHQRQTQDTHHSQPVFQLSVQATPFVPANLQAMGGSSSGGGGLLGPSPPPLSTAPLAAGTSSSLLDTSGGSFLSTAASSSIFAGRPTGSSLLASRPSSQSPQSSSSLLAAPAPSAPTSFQESRGSLFGQPSPSVVGNVGAGAGPQLGVTSVFGSPTNTRPPAQQASQQQQQQQRGQHAGGGSGGLLPDLSRGQQHRRRGGGGGGFTRGRGGRGRR